MEQTKAGINILEYAGIIFCNKICNKIIKKLKKSIDTLKDR